MDLTIAQKILGKMAKERYISTDAVLDEYLRYRVDGEVGHFWPDENTACKVLLNQNDMLVGV